MDTARRRTARARPRHAHPRPCPAQHIAPPPSKQVSTHSPRRPCTIVSREHSARWGGGGLRDTYWTERQVCMCSFSNTRPPMACPLPPPQAMPQAAGGDMVDADAPRPPRHDLRPREVRLCIISHRESCRACQIATRGAQCKAGQTTVYHNTARLLGLYTSYILCITY